MDNYEFRVAVRTYGRGDLGDPEQFAENMAEALEEAFADPDGPTDAVGKHPEWSVTVEYDEDGSW